MKKTTLLLCLACFILASCNSGKKEFTHFAFKDGKDDNYGMITLKGKKIFEKKFENCPTAAINGLFFVENKDHEYEVYSVKDPNKTAITDTYKGIAPFTENVTPSVKKDEVIKYIDKKGKVKFELDKKYKTATMFVDGYSYIITKDGKTDAISTKGKIVEFSNYSIIRVIDNNKFLVEDYFDRSKPENSDKTAKIHIVNKKGDVKYTLEDFAGISPDYKYYIFTDGKGKSGVKKLDGKVVLEASDQPIEFDEDGNLIFSSNNNDGVKTVKGKELIKSHYASLVSVGDGCYIAKTDKKYGLINKKDKELIPFKYSSLKHLSGDIFVARNENGDRSILVKKNGKELGEFYTIGTDPGNSYVRSQYKEEDQNNKDD